MRNKAAFDFFAVWFEAQHMHRMASGMPTHSDQQLRDMVQAGRVADRVLACRELWDEKRQSALYAWNTAKPSGSAVEAAGERSKGTTMEQSEPATGGCPCIYIGACRYSCTCVSPHMSGGCSRCCQYGSKEQRTASAKRLAMLIDAAPSGAAAVPASSKKATP